MGTECEITWGRRLGDEFWSPIVSPLTYGLLADLMAERMLRRPLRAAGLRELAREPVFRHFGGTVYVNLRLVEALFALLPGPLRAPGLVSLLAPEAQERLRQAPVVSASALAAIARISLNDKGCLPWRHADLFERAAKRVEDEFATPMPGELLAQAGLDELYRLLTGLRGPLGSYLEAVGWPVGFGYLTFHLARALLASWAASESSSLWPELVLGLGGTRPQRAARDVAAFGRRFAALFAGERSGLPAAELEARVKRDPDAAKALEGLLARHGHRMSGRDLTMPSWREAPATVVALAAKSLAAKALAGDALARRSIAEKRLAALVGNPVKRQLLTGLLGYCRGYCAIREEMRYVADYFLCRMRSLALEIGKRLVSEGSLGAPDDVFYLELQELGEAVARRASVAAIARSRRLAYQGMDEQWPPELVRGEQADGAARPSEEYELSGEVASPGLARGPVRLVTQSADLDRVQPGEIVVARFTDPSWMPALAVAGGLVLECGGQLSHGAIMARELGIAALVNVARATRRLQTGDMVAVDAGRGSVLLISASASRPAT